MRHEKTIEFHRSQQFSIKTTGEWHTVFRFEAFSTGLSSIQLLCTFPVSLVVDDGIVKKYTTRFCCTDVVIIFGSWDFSSIAFFKLWTTLFQGYYQRYLMVAMFDIHSSGIRRKWIISRYISELYSATDGFWVAANSTSAKIESFVID